MILGNITVTMIALVALGTLVGIIFGAIPGLTAAMGVILFLPFTYKMGSVDSFALLLGIYCGGTYGGSISAILLKTPGTASAAATVLDGHVMAQKGQGKKALSAAVVGSFFGGIFSCVILILLSKRLAMVALKFGPAEYFALGIFGMSIVASLSANNLAKGLFSALLGLLISTVGMDPIGGTMRFTFRQTTLYGGISSIPALIGIFAIGEMFIKCEKASRAVEEDPMKLTGGEGVTLKDVKNNIFNIIRSAALGTIVGIIPATGSAIAAWLGYNTAKSSSKHPERYGSGSVEGVFAPETANNAVTGGALIPLLTLGIPGDMVTAIMMGALTIQGLTPGVLLFQQHYDVVVGIYIIMILANIFMLIFGLFGSRLFVKVLRVPMRILMPVVMVLCFVGAFALNNRIFDIWVALVMGVVGWLFSKADIPVPPLLLGLLLGPTVESNFIRAMTITKNGAWIFFTRPISLGLLIVAGLFAVTPLIKARLARRKRNDMPAIDM